MEIPVVALDLTLAPSLSLRITPERLRVTTSEAAQKTRRDVFYGRVHSEWKFRLLHSISLWRHPYLCASLLKIGGASCMKKLKRLAVMCSMGGCTQNGNSGCCTRSHFGAILIFAHHS